ncbi:hypothetical protein [Arthrobacter sp. SLBN-53]|uniref:Acb2/Tad1 domain-containing protein n=1 Tax=Arthrobacter sp. SLBN-53 TaxID=2768412 RepID=UPI00114DA9F0|nr:hypothetical protein [Arthrobacter sp. SLBN-53]TQK29394.1 hypothetical protein FBY28_2397 [Arthrobacter sp. SLBN-53]
MAHSTPATFADIENRFSFHPATTDETKAKHEQVRELHKAVAHQLDDMMPPSREKSLAMTKLEESMFWANASIARG